MPVFVHSETGEVLHVAPEGMTGAPALRALGWALQGKAATDPADPPSDAEVPPVDLPEAPAPSDPARPHNGASRKAWAAYAESVGVTPGTLTRDELIAAVDAK